MKHENSWGHVTYDLKPETIKAQAKLNKILKPTGFNHRTKALWAYYRGNESTSKICKARALYILNLELNGALRQRLINLCQGCRRLNCENRYDEQCMMDRFNASIRPTTIARWEYAMTLIDIAKAKRHGN